MLKSINWQETVKQDLKKENEHGQIISITYAITILC